MGLHEPKQDRGKEIGCPYALGAAFFLFQSVTIFMKFFFPIILLLAGCTNSGMGSIDWKPPGKADNYTCSEAAGFTQQYCETGEHPNLCDC